MEQDITPEQAYLSVYFCGKENCEPGHSFGPAVRPHYLLHVVLDGKGFYRKNGVTYSLHKGDAFLIPPMESTYYEADQEDPWTYAWVGFDGKNCKQTLRQTVFFHSFVFLNSVPEKTAQICDAMAFLLQSFQNSHGNQLQLTGSLLLLLSHIPLTGNGRNSHTDTFKKPRNTLKTTIRMISKFLILPVMWALTALTYTGFLWKKNSFPPSST